MDCKVIISSLSDRIRMGLNLQSIAISAREVKNIFDMLDKKSIYEVDCTIWL